MATSMKTWTLIWEVIAEGGGWVASYTVRDDKGKESGPFCSAATHTSALDAFNELVAMKAEKTSRLEDAYAEHLIHIEHKYNSFRKDKSYGK